VSTVLTLNGGSSSIRFSLYETAGRLRRLMAGKIDRIGLAAPQFAVDGAVAPPAQVLRAGSRPEAVEWLLDWLESQGALAGLAGIGHRVVYGLNHGEPAAIDAALLAELKRVTPFDPEHMPAEIALIETLLARHPRIPQFACFDTAFHRSMPRVAQLLPLPRRYDERGIRRYGFHGLSYAYLLEELQRLGDPAATRGRVILAHLGNGASMAAVRDGASIDTSMGFTPAAGLVMSTRSGDLDPGLCYYLMQSEGMSAERFQTLVNHESGLAGISGGGSPDVRDLLAHEADDERAAEALAVFCYQAKKWLGAYAAALGGLDTLVFAGGIGENAAPLRERICAGLQFLGLELDATRNAAHAGVISGEQSRVTVRVIRTDEESMIATLVARRVTARAQQKE